MYANKLNTKNKKDDYIQTYYSSFSNLYTSQTINISRLLFQFKSTNSSL